MGVLPPGAPYSTSALAFPLDSELDGKKRFPPGLGGSCPEAWRWGTVVWEQVVAEARRKPVWRFFFSKVRWGREGSQSSALRTPVTLSGGAAI